MNAERQRPITLVTGSTDGIGKETARQLLAHGHEVILHGRSPARLAAAQAELQGLGRVHAAAGDLASLASVRALATDLLARFPRLDVVIHNAGIYQNEPALSVDGFELTFAVNHLAPFLLSHLLLPALTAASSGPTSGAAGPARIINVSSIAHARARLDASTWRTLTRFDPYGAYAQSKLANVIFTVELARRLPAGIVTHALHPGVVSTKLLTAGFGMNGPDSLAAGADTSVWLATAPEAAATTGRYHVKRREARASPLAADPKLAADFYLDSARMVGVSPLPGR